ncbi:MAG: 16S rRNA (cytosine(1402)-N(4))-methyltransferase RsmH [Pseudoclavibacter sp.]|nr:16S rRNA (cytosine(1402)-N(4))-methyltransferase RsmH [Pseudoclavibacter sp.]
MSESRDPARLHEPVMLARCVELLAPALGEPGRVCLDATLGLGGHAEAILRAAPDAVLLGVDRDAEALELARERLAGFGDRVLLSRRPYHELHLAMAEHGVTRLHGAIFDLGVSSLQLDEPERGFSYARDAPLDMRMDRSGGRTAEQIVNGSPEPELRELFRRYGEERLAARYAGAVVRERERSPIRTTGRLVEVLQRATPAARRDAGHPAKRVFQALRIEVNGELASLEAALPRAMAALETGGRIVVESYQSLEDRFVKRTLAAASSSTAPPGLPVELPEHLPAFRLLVRGAERAPQQEQRRNPRSIPVRLRAAERIRRNEP